MASEKQGIRTVRLSDAQVAFIQSNISLPPDLRDRLTKSFGTDSNDFDLDLQTTNDLVNWLTERLARVGFDRDYSPTTEGSFLEAFIDAVGPSGWEET